MIEYTQGREEVREEAVDTQQENQTVALCCCAGDSFCLSLYLQASSLCPEDKNRP